MAPRESRAAPEWDAAQVRELFFSYSRGRGYKFLPSGPVLPVGDSKGPFHGALDHFNQAFLDPAPWSHVHAGSAFSLHCINMNDMLVDFSDPSHHSLMDIFCNWFVGSTSNSDAIHCVLNFLTGTCKFSAGRIYVTCYADDDESREICMKFLSEKQLLNFTCETNYYIGKNGCGPCGPCTKIFYLPSDNRKYHGHSAITIDGETYIELANIVSVEEDKEDDIVWPLFIKHAVSGINYECLVTLLQHKESFYDTDLFTKMFKAIRKYACNKVQPYSGNASVTCDVDAAYRLFADHVRIISCASAPQSQLGERGREYFLNFIDRRAIESGHQKLKIEAHFYPELLKVAVIMMDPIYPDLNIKDRIEEILKTEMLIYKKALDEIQHELPKSARKMKTKDNEGTEKSKCPVVWRRTHVVEFFGRLRHIIHKDKNEGCSLISLCNVLLLGGKISLGSDVSEVSDYYLLHLVQNCLLYGNEKMKLDHNLERSYFQLEVLNVLPDLSGYLFMDMRFNSISDFVDSPQYALFQYLGVPLYHGWLIDPQDKDLASAMSTQSFVQHSIELAVYKSMKESGVERKGDAEELDDVHRAVMRSLGTSDDAIKSREDQVEIIARFLQGSRLTSHGLECLRNELIEGEPGVLLWNDRFITLAMVGGALCLLVNDLNVLTKTGIVWEMLKEVNQGGTSVDGKFTAVDLDLNTTMLPFTKKDRKKEKKKKSKEKKRLSKLPSTSISGGQEEKIPEENQYISTCALPSTSISEEKEEELPQENEDIPAFVEAGDVQVGSPQPAVRYKRIYQMRMIDFFGLRTHIIYQDDNGPCTLLAICNVLLLKGVIKFEPDVSEFPEDKLLSLLEGVLEKCEKMKCEGRKYSDLQRQVRDVIPILPHSVEINMCFNSIDGFEATPESMLFDYLGITPYHGWISDDDVLHSAIRGHTYKSLTQEVTFPSFPNGLVEMALKFLNGPQLSNFGLRSLRRELEENVPFVLFWNRHFHTLIKFKGELYTLAADVGYLESGVSWISLNEVNGAGLLVDDKFEPINFVSSITPVVPSISGQKAEDIPEENEDIPTFAEPETDHWEIYFGNIIPPMSVGIDYSRFAAGGSVHSRGATPFSKMPSGAPISCANHSGSGYYGFMSLEKFVLLPYNRFAEQRTIFPHSTSQIVADTLKIGRIIANNILQHIIEAHEAKNCWNGKFNLSSILIVDGFGVLIASPFCEEFSWDAMVKDYIAFVELIFPLFEVVGVGMPAFFSELEKTLRNFEPHNMRHHQLARFWDFIRNHLAFKSSMWRTNVFTGLYRIRRSMPRRLRRALKAVLLSQSLVDDWRSVIAESGHPLLEKVLRHSGVEDPDENGSYLVQNHGVIDLVQNDDNKPEYGLYQNTLFSAAMFPRHVNEHGTDMSKTKDGEGPGQEVVDGEGPEQEEVINLPSDLDLLCSHYMETVLSMVLHELYCSDFMTTKLWLMLEELFEAYSTPEAS